MILLNKDNIKQYLESRFPGGDFSGSLDIYQIGEGSKENEGDGYLNYIFRVRSASRGIILKQSRSSSKRGGFTGLPEERTSLEYQIMCIRHAIVPGLIPKPYFYDGENHVMGMEDASHLKILRYQLSRNIIFPEFPRKIAEYMAKTHFYTSEYYQDTGTFRDLTIHFMNHRMREVYDEMAFITMEDSGRGFGVPVNEEYMPFARQIVLDPRVVAERYELRHLYITRCEALLHADLHTSNVMISRSEMKVIDMEYTFCGPMAYDIGYIESNILSQYICSLYRRFPSEEEKVRFRQYCLDAMKEIFNEYFRIFSECWKRDAKAVYRDVEGLLPKIKASLLRDMTGFCASITFSRCSGPYGLPEFSELETASDRAKAVCTAMIFSRTAILKRDSFRNVEEWVSELSMVDHLFNVYTVSGNR